MNVIQGNMCAGKRNNAGDRPMVIKPTIIGNALMPPPSNVLQRFTTPSSSRSRPKDGCSSSRSKSTPSVPRDTHVIAAICEGRGRAAGIVGIAAVDIHRPVLVLCQILDGQTYTATLTKLNILRPVEVLVPASFVEGATHSRIVTIIMEQFPNLTVNAIPRSEFNRGRGLHMLKTVCAGAFTSIILQLDQKFYTLAASCALLRYVEQSRRVIYSPKTVKVEYQEPEHITAIDIDTANLLELTSCKQNASLFTVLNYCCTTPGKKLLRTNILQPPCRKDLIETRLDCVQELLENPNLLTRLQETLKPLSDIESALTFGIVLPSTASSVSERQLNYTLQLKGLLNAVQPLAEELKATKHPVFRFIYNRIEGLDTRQKILDLISEIINVDAHLSKGQAGELQRCFAIKGGINGILDLSRRLYSEGVDAMRAYVDELTEKYNLPLRVQHTIKNGFHIMLPLTKALRNLKRNDLPPVFTKVERFSNHFYLTTMDMINFDKRLKNNSTEIQNISNMLIYQLLVSIRPYIGDLYNLCEDVAQLDMLVSLARASSLPNWVRPKIVDNYMNLEGARHPILEHVADQEPVANSVYCFPRLRLHILTGPNMAGKSILLHSISLIQILLQMGCYVPCSSASMRVCDRVYARVSDHEPQATIQASSFAVEMEKIAYLLNTVGETSLVLLDEMCKTTGCDEGVPLAMAVCEQLLKVQCFAFVATHYGALTVLEDLYPNVANWHLETLEEMRANNTRISLKFTYKLLPGITPVECYGIKLSQIFNSSKSISDRAEDLYKYLLPFRKSLVSGNTKKSPEFQKYKLQAELDLLKIKNQLTDEIQKDKISNFQLKTGLSFQPSPISIARSSEINQSSSKKTSSDSSDKKKSASDSWVPTPKSSSNHEFSVPGSSKISDKGNSNIFSMDGLKKSDNSLLDCSFKYDEIESFNSDLSLSSTHKHVPSSQESIPVGQNKNYFFNNSIFQTNKSDFQTSEFSSAKNTMFNRSLKSVNFIVDSTPTNTENIQEKETSINKYKNVSIWSSVESTAIDKSLNSANLTEYSPEKSVLQLNNETGKRSDNETKNNSNWSSVQNTIINKGLNSVELTINPTPKNSCAENTKDSVITLKSCNQNKFIGISESLPSTPSTYNTVYSKLPVTASANSIHVDSSTENVPTLDYGEQRGKQNMPSENISISSSMLNTSSPILKKYAPKKSVDVKQIRLVSNLYDSESELDSDHSEVIEIESDDSIIVQNQDLEICSPDELNFAAYLNLRKGVTSTPINSQASQASQHKPNLNNSLNSTQYFTSNSNENTLQTPVKRKPTLPAQEFPQKLLKKSLLLSVESPVFLSSASFKSCENSSNFSTCVQIGQNFKKHSFEKPDDDVFEKTMY